MGLCVLCNDYSQLWWELTSLRAGSLTGKRGTRMIQYPSHPVGGRTGKFVSSELYVHSAKIYRSHYPKYEGEATPSSSRAPIHHRRGSFPSSANNIF